MSSDHASGMTHARSLLVFRSEECLRVAYDIRAHSGTVSERFPYDVAMHRSEPSGHSGEMHACGLARLRCPPQLEAIRQNYMCEPCKISYGECILRQYTFVGDLVRIMAAQRC